MIKGADYEEHYNSYSTADKWIEYCNKENLNNLKDITENPLEVKGPKGLAFLDIEELSDWMKRAKLKLETFERYANETNVLLSQYGTWFNEDGTIRGCQVVYTIIKVSEGRVKSLVRLDDKHDAFNISGLCENNKIE